MFNKISDTAEKLVTNASRRHFLGSLGRWAGVTALALGGALAFTGEAHAGSKPCYSSTGKYQCNNNEQCCLDGNCHSKNIPCGSYNPWGG